MWGLQVSISLITDPASHGPRKSWVFSLPGTQAPWKGTLRPSGGDGWEDLLSVGTGAARSVLRRPDCLSNNGRLAWELTSTWEPGRGRDLPV